MVEESTHPPFDVIVGLPADDPFAILGRLKRPADTTDLMIWLLEVTLSYAEATRRLAAEEPGALELLAGTFNLTGDVMQELATQVLHNRESS